MQPAFAPAADSRVGTAVTCPWCKQYWPSRPGAECSRCGGALPAPPGASYAVAPPPPPRRLPPSYARDVLLWKNVLVIIGFAFAGFGALFGVLGVGLCFVQPVLGLAFMAFGLLFGGIGLAAVHGGRKGPRRRLVALAEGTATQGQVVAVGVDHSETMNGQSPWRAQFVFNANGAPVSGDIKSYDPILALWQPGQPVWVVYLPRDPSTNSVWPPLA